MLLSPEAPEPQARSFKKWREDLLEVYMRAVPALLSYDFSFFLVALGFIIPRLPENNTETADDITSAAALTTTYLSTLAFIGYAAHFQSSFMVGELLGRLRGEKANLASAQQDLKAVTPTPLDPTSDNESEASTGEAITLLPPESKSTSTSHRNSIVTTVLMEPLSLGSASRIQQLRDAIAESEAKIEVLKEQMSTLPANTLIAGALPTVGVTIAMAYAQEILIGCKQSAAPSVLTGHFFISYFPFFLTFPSRLVAEFPLIRVNPTAAMLMGGAGFVTSMGLSVGLGFGLGPFPRMGMQGLGIAGGVGTTTTAILFWAYDLRSKHFRDLSFFSLKAIQNQLEQLRLLALSAGVNILAVGSEISAGFALNIIAGLYGVLPAQSIATQYANLILLIFTTAFGQVTSQMVADEIGHAKQVQTLHAYHRVRQVANSGLAANLILESALALTVMIKPAGFKALVTGDGTMTSTEEISLQIMAFATLTQMVTYLSLQYLRAAGDNAKASTISSASLWLGVILAGALGAWAGQPGISTGFLIGTTIGAITLLCRVDKILSPAGLGFFSGHSTTVNSVSAETKPESEEEDDSLRTPLLRGTGASSGNGTRNHAVNVGQTLDPPTETTPLSPGRTDTTSASASATTHHPPEEGDPELDPQDQEPSTVVWFLQTLRDVPGKAYTAFSNFLWPTQDGPI